MDHPDDRDDTHRLWRRLAGGSIPRAEARKMGAGRFGCDYAFVFSSVQIFRLFNQNLNQIFGAELPTQIFNLPIGISFYTFQAITYVVDVYRGKAQVAALYANLLLYVALFPQLIAGPIVRYTDIAAQLENREMTLPGFSKRHYTLCDGARQEGAARQYCGSGCNEPDRRGFVESLCARRMAGYLRLYVSDLF